MAKMAAGKKGKMAAGKKGFPAWQHFGKNLLRHVPDTRGSCLWVRQKGPKKESGLLKEEFVAAHRTVENCEALTNMKQYLSDHGATISYAVDYLHDAKNPGETLLVLLREHPDFLAAADFLNRRASADKSKDDAEKHVTAYLKFFKETLRGDQLKNLRQTMRDAARLFLLSASLVEQKALFSKPAQWHDKVDKKKQIGDFKDFLRRGKEDDLETWLASVAKKMTKDHQPTKKSQLADRADDSDGNDSDEDGDGSGSSSSSSSSGSGDDKKKKKQKDKKDKKNSKKNDKDKKDKKNKTKKSKKDADDKDGKKQSSGSGGSGSTGS
jgi:hypothetical protein